MKSIKTVFAAATIALSGAGAAQAALIDLAALGLVPGPLEQSETGTVLVDYSPMTGLTALALGSTGATFLANASSDSAVTLGFFSSSLVTGDMLAQGTQIDPGTVGGDILHFTIDTDADAAPDYLVTFTGEFGTDAAKPYDLSGMGFSDGAADYRLEALAPIPLPAGLPMALAAFAGLAALRRRRASV